MKRHPKRARPLWGCAKPRRYRGPVGSTGLTFTFPPGTYVVGDTYSCSVTTPGIRGDAPISFGYVVGPVKPRPGVLMFATDVATPTDALSRAISEGLRSKGEHEVTVAATVTGDMAHASAEYVPSHIERVQFFEAVREMTIDPGTVLVLPSCEIKVDT